MRLSVDIEHTDEFKHYHGVHTIYPTARLSHSSQRARGSSEHC
jgi:hypothetical protein